MCGVFFYSIKVTRVFFVVKLKAIPSSTGIGRGGGDVKGVSDPKKRLPRSEYAISVEIATNISEFLGQSAGM